MELFLIGAGGLARELAWLAESLDWPVSGFADVEPGTLGKHQIVSDEDLLERADSFAVVIGLGRPKDRERVTQRYLRREDVLFPTLKHETATVMGPCELGRGVCLMAGCSLTGNIRVEDFVVLNPNVTVGHDASIGWGTVANPSSTISGGVRVGASVLIGAGAIILENRTIGDGATVGAGAVVTKDVPPGSTVVGVPARPMAY